MKQYFLPILAVVFAGNFTDIDSAFNAFLPGGGSSKQLKEEITESGTVAQFEDVNGDIVTLNEGDAAVGVKNEGGTPVGFRRADKSEVSGWLIGVETAPTAAANTANANTDGEGATPTAEGAGSDANTGGAEDEVDA